VLTFIPHKTDMVAGEGLSMRTTIDVTLRHVSGIPTVVKFVRRLDMCEIPTYGFRPHRTLTPCVYRYLTDAHPLNRAPSNSRTRFSLLEPDDSASAQWIARSERERHNLNTNMEGL